MLMRYPQTTMAPAHTPPLGAHLTSQGCQFKVFSDRATSMRVLLYDHVDGPEPTEVIRFDAADRVGDVWNCLVRGVQHGQLYHLQASGPWDPDRGLWYRPGTRLVDPYAYALAGDFQSPTGDILRPPKCVVVDNEFDWEDDRWPRTALSESVIYEMHVGGFTKSPTSGVENPGTYLGVIEKIDYLKSLGVTAVELLPVHDFPILDVDGTPPERKQYWGYDPMAFFSPHRGYASGTEPGAQVIEFKQMVHALHEAGIEVILDVVFNHTCEGNHKGSVISMKGLANRVYYMLESHPKYYANYSGTGNTLNCNHPIVAELIQSCLRYWVANYRVDGFRFDLASILNRTEDGHLHRTSPLIKNISRDPILSRTKLIAEAWDAAGAYQVGWFDGGRWSEWNGPYRDDVRRYWRGDAGMQGALATRLAGSSDLYQHGDRGPLNSVNFVTCHDGQTANDVVTYEFKWNHENGEGNRDGCNNNLSANYGFEGETDDAKIQRIRARQIRNLFATMMLSQGVPMLLAGDEFRRTQRGNNNAYCQDNPISWFDWDLVSKHQDLIRFVQALIQFRRSCPTVRRRSFFTGQGSEANERRDVGWYSAAGGPAAWGSHDSALTCLMNAPARSDNQRDDLLHLLLMINPTASTRDFRIPSAASSDDWRLFLDTAAEPPADVFPCLNGRSPNAVKERLQPRSLICFVADSHPETHLPPSAESAT